MMRRARALVAALLALWAPVLIGLPMGMGPAASAMVGDAGSMPGMAGMAGMHADAPASARHDGAPAQPSHQHDRCCILCVCCAAVVPLPAARSVAPDAAFADATPPRRTPALSPSAAHSGERPPVRAPPTLLDV